MKYRTRIQYTEAYKALMWKRWRRASRCRRSLSYSVETIPRSAAFWCYMCAPELLGQPRARNLGGAATARNARQSLSKRHRRLRGSTDSKRIGQWKYRE